MGKTSKLRNFQEYSHSCVKRALQSKTMMAAKLLVALGILMILNTEVEGNPAQIIPSQAGDRSSTRLESPTLYTLPQTEDREQNGFKKVAETLAILGGSKATGFHKNGDIEKIKKGIYDDCREQCRPKRYP